MPTLSTPGGLSLSANTKTGWSLNLPAIETCPGSTPACRAVCYGLRGRMVLNGALVTSRNWEAVRDNPEALMGIPLPKDGSAIRLLGVGDIASRAHCLALFRFCDAHPERVFWAYTRSRAIVGGVLRHRRLPDNLTLFASVDRDNHVQALRWARRWGLPVAYMDTGDPLPGMGESFLCPALDPQKKERYPLTRRPDESACQRCRYCFSPKVEAHRAEHGVRFPEH